MNNLHTYYTPVNNCSQGFIYEDDYMRLQFHNTYRWTTGGIKMFCRQRTTKPTLRAGDKVNAYVYQKDFNLNQLIWGAIATRKKVLNALGNCTRHSFISGYVLLRKNKRN
jgi:hypothetical protein